ncbi:MAG: hypothetical protein KAX24_10180, partial [Anaerolineae bacterium]|nr:hypothetical protein [Anaerolineae bacterium]
LTAFVVQFQTAGLIVDLVKTDDPVATVFGWLVELWDAAGVDDALLNDYYDEREKATRHLTWTLEQVYGDFGGVYLHRGLSLMECLTPWLVVRRK